MTNEAPEVASASSNRPRLILAVIALLGIAYLGHAYWFDLHYVDTDNAAIGGDIVPISSRISGFVISVPVRENQSVKIGDLLAQLDDRDARAHLAQAEADYANALSAAGQTGQTGQALAQVQTAEAQTRQAYAVIAQSQAEHDNDLRELERLKVLLKREVISQHDLDNADALEKASRARLQAAHDAASAAQQQVGVYSAALRGADARLLAAKAARDLAANNLADTRIYASLNGVVSQKTLEPGQFMQPGQPMMNLVADDSVWVVANLKETQLDGLHLGSSAEFKVDAYPGLTWQGKLESISPATGSKFTLLPPDNATGNFTKVVQRIPIRIFIPANQHKDAVLRAGMSAVVTVQKS